MSAALAEIASKLKITLVYKTSFDKANRSSVESRRGMGLFAGSGGEASSLTVALSRIRAARP